MLALVEAKGFINSDPRTKSRVFGEL
jgi:hypothetical protein